MSWSDYELQWKCHARTREFAGKVNRARRVIQEADSREELKLFASISGGKDSVAMLGLLAEAEIDVPVAHGTSPMAIPDSELIAKATCEQLGYELHVVNPTEDPWEILRTLDGSVFDGPNWTRFCRAAGEIQVLVWYRFAQELNGVYMGLRAEESNARMMNAKVRGEIYHVANGDSWAVCPVLWWSVDDVYAFLVSRDLPIHPYYRRIYEQYGVKPDESRVSMAVPREICCAHGALAYLRGLYPDLWQRIREARPELSRLG